MKKAFITNFRVGWSDLDPNGHMKNTAYLNQALDCRTEYFGSYGLTWKDFERFGMGPVFFKDEVRYHKEMLLGQKGTNECRLLGISEDGSHFKIENIILTDKQQLSATVQTEVVWLNLKTRKITTPVKDLHRIILELPKSTTFEELKSLSGKKDFAPESRKHWRPEKSLGGLILASASKMKKIHDQTMVQASLAHMKIQRMGILSFLSDTPRTQSELCQLLDVSAPTMVQTLAKLQKEKLVRKEHDPEDGRRFYFSLTKKGLEDFKAAKKVTRNLGKGIDQHLRTHNTSEEEITRAKVIIEEVNHYLDLQLK